MAVLPDEAGVLGQVAREGRAIEVIPSGVKGIEKLPVDQDVAQLFFGGERLPNFRSCGFLGKGTDQGLRVEVRDRCGLHREVIVSTGIAHRKDMGGWRLD